LFLALFWFFLLRLLAGFDGRLPYQPPCALCFSPVFGPIASNTPVFLSALSLLKLVWSAIIFVRLGV